MLSCRYVDGDGNPRTEFVDIVAVASGDATGIYAALWQALENGLDMSVIDIKSKMIGCTFDGAAVNQGVKGGVVKKLKDDIAHILVSIWCAPHKLELSLTDLRNKNKNPSTTIISDVELGIEPVYRFYYASAKRRRLVNEIAVVLEEDPVYFSKPVGTRWMASRHRAYMAVKKHYLAIVLHMEDTSTKGGEDGAKCVGYLRTLKSRKFLDGLVFLIDVLEILTDVSVSFQKNELLVTDVSVKLCEAIMKLERMKTHKGPAYTRYQEQVADNKYLDTVKLEGVPVSDATLTAFLTDCIKFMKARFEHLESSPFTDFHIFDFRNHPNLAADLADYGDENIIKLVNYFSTVLTEEERESIPLQWPALKALMKTRHRKSPFEILRGLLVEKPEMVQDILVLVRIMITLSPSSAAVERGFSQMKAIKTSRKSRMTNSNLAALMKVNHMDATLDTFDPSPAILQWMRMPKKRSRLLERRPSQPAAPQEAPPQPAPQGAIRERVNIGPVVPLLPLGPEAIQESSDSDHDGIESSSDSDEPFEGF